MEQTGKCPSCGGTMLFNPGFKSLVCQSCGRKDIIPELVSKIAVNELDFLSAQNTASHDWGMEIKMVTCKQCGARMIQNKLQMSGMCPFCGSTTVEAADPGIVHTLAERIYRNEEALDNRSYEMAAASEI